MGRSRLRKLRKLLPLIWPNTVRLNKSLKRLKRGQRWLEPSFLSLVLVQSACKHNTKKMVPTSCILQARNSIVQTFDVPHKLYLNKQQQIVYHQFDAINIAPKAKIISNCCIALCTSLA